MTELLNQEKKSAVELGNLAPVGRRPEGAKLPSSTADAPSPSEVPNPEVSASDQRRSFTAAYKLKILSQADACCKNGDLGKLLRREGLYSSHLTTWRRQRDQGMLDGLSKKRGKKKQELSAVLHEKKKLEQENARLKKQLEKAEIIIDFQKKTSQMLEMMREEERKK